MAGFAVLADRLEEQLQRAAVADVLRAIQTDLETADERVAQEFARLLKPMAPASLATLSRSSTVLSALSTARDLVREVHVLESWPGGEGRRLAEEAGRFHSRVILHPDQELELMADRADMGVIGADALFPDGAVRNKVLSAALAEALHSRRKPFYVLASTWKIEPYPPPARTVDTGDAQVFEVVPARLITAVVTEKGLASGARHRLA
ncbi:MAG: hypothetical protein V1873_00510 [Verrucomicrobiota bacterium]